MKLTLGGGNRDNAKSKNQSSKSAKGVNEPPPPAPTDPRLPLTARQVFSITKSWKGIARAMEQTGVLMFIKLFEEHIELLELFSKFRNLKTREAQSESEELQEHAAKVMNTLDEAIKALENIDFFFEYLHQVGRTHHKLPGFHKEYFWKIEKPFLEAVKETLGDRYTDNIESIYTITIKFILETLVKGFEQAESGTNS